LLTFPEISQNRVSNAQTSNVTATGCEKGIVKGEICVEKVPTYKLEKGKWMLYVDGVNGALKYFISKW
jgi:hypothetical protein